jgi:hypothetical protein
MQTRPRDVWHLELANIPFSSGFSSAASAFRSSGLRAGPVSPTSRAARAIHAINGSVSSQGLVRKVPLGEPLCRFRTSSVILQLSAMTKTHYQFIEVEADSQLDYIDDCTGWQPFYLSLGSHLVIFFCRANSRRRAEA